MGGKIWVFLILEQGLTMKKAENYLNVINTKVPLLVLMVSGTGSYTEKQAFCVF